MNVYTAEKPDGTIYAVLGGFGADRDGFVRLVLNHLRELPEDEATPQSLDLFEWPDETLAGAWLEGKLSPAGSSWTSLARDYEFGAIRYEYVGDGEGDWSYEPRVNVA